MNLKSLINELPPGTPVEIMTSMPTQVGMLCPLGVIGYITEDKLLLKKFDPKLHQKIITKYGNGGVPDDIIISGDVIHMIPLLTEDPI